MGQRRFANKKFEGMEPTLKVKIVNFSEETQAKQYSENVDKQFTVDLVRAVEVLQLDMPDPVDDPSEGATPIEVE